MQRRWGELQVRKLNSLEVHVIECTQAVQAIPHHRTLSSSSSVELELSASNHVTSRDGETACREDYDKQLVKGYMKATSSMRRQKKILAQLQLPSWLGITSLGLEISGQRSLFTMSLNVQVYRNVEWDAPIMQYAREGNVRGIQELISLGKATPFDRWSLHETVLNVCESTPPIAPDRL
jgi:hypothetical protein